MKLCSKEPEFTKETISLGDDIAQQLIDASRFSREKWGILFTKYKEELPALMQAAHSHHTCHHPLVSGFLFEWAKNISWGITATYPDAIGIKVPDHHLEKLALYGGVESFEFLVGDCGKTVAASMGNNDHNKQFGFILNCPGWMELALHADYDWFLEQQIQMVVQHEMAHFIHQKTIRSEIHAHCRGIASLLWACDKIPASQEEFDLIILQDFPELVKNEEIKTLILNKRNAWRLIRYWIHLFKEHAKEHGVRQKLRLTSAPI